jgi:hypothetical protein
MKPWMHRARCTALAAVCALLLPQANALEYNSRNNTVRLDSLDDFDRCVREVGSDDLCLDGLRAYAKRTPAQAFAAGKRARLQYQHWAALPLFDQALGSRPDAKACADEDVALAVVSGLALPPTSPAVPVAQRLLGVCFEQVKARVLKEFEGAQSYYLDNTCPSLRQRGAEPPRCQAPAKSADAGAAAAAAVGADVQALAAVDPKTVKLYKQTAMLLRGANGQEVMLVRTERAGVYLVRFNRVDGPWRGKVLAAVERPAGHESKDYVVLADQREWVAVTLRNGSYEAHPYGAGSVALTRVRLEDEKRKMSAAEVVDEVRR